MINFISLVFCFKIDCKKYIKTHIIQTTFTWQWYEESISIGRAFKSGINIQCLH